MTVEVTYKFDDEIYVFNDVSDAKIDQGVYIIQQDNQMTRIPLDGILFAQEFYD